MCNIIVLSALLADSMWCDPKVILNHPILHHLITIILDYVDV